MRNLLQIQLMSIGVLAAVVSTAAAPAWAGGVSITPATITPGTNDGAIVVNSFNFVPQVVAHYSGPTDDTKSVSSSAPPNLTPGTSTVTGTLKIINSPDPSIFATGQIDLTGLAGGQVNVQDITHYSFQITGAAPTAQVFVNATGNVGFSPGSRWGPASTFSFFRVQQQFNGPIIIDETLSLGSSAAGTFVDASNPTVATTTPTLGFTLAQNFTFSTNTIYDVTLEASMGGTLSNVSGSLSESLFANIDPMFTVAGPFTIEISPGFGGVTVEKPPGPSVPEPATWALMLLGFGGVGAALRRGRRAVAA